MKFPYAVKYNGKFYFANTEIKENKPKVVEKKPATEVEKKAVKGDK